MWSLILAALISLIPVGVSGQQRMAPVKIGAAGPFTGDLSKIGLDSLNAIYMAVDEANAEGGVRGRKIEVVVADDSGDPAKAVIVAERLAMDRNVMGVIGPMNSSAVKAALPIYQRVSLVLISQSATNPALTEMGYRVMHRICPRDDAQGPAAAKFIVEVAGARNVYIIDDKSTYGQGLADQVEATLRAAGVTTARGQIAPEDRDFSPILTRVKAAKPDLLYLALPSPSQAAALIKQATGLGLSPKLMGGDGLKERDQLIAGAGGSAQGMWVTAIGRDIKEVPEAREFITRFEGKHGAMSIFSGQSYEATKILIEAMRKAAGDDPAGLSRQKVLEAVHSTRDYRGILGFPVSFDSKGDVVGASIYVFQVQKDDFVQVREYPVETK
jgi:branched-chain amino acid transport system substrate-binding protein